MRTALTIALAASLTGCVNNWQYYGIPEGCTRALAYPDADGDGWGDPDSNGDGVVNDQDTGEVLCMPLEAGSVRNNRDCDDDDETVTGRVGSLCPAQLVADNTDFTPVTSGSEFVLVHPDTDVVWAAAAEQSCGPFGWGGGLATFRDRGQLETVLSGLGTRALYAGFVGFHPTLHTWGAYDDAGTWVEDPDGGDFAVTLCNCMDGADPQTCDDRYTADLGYLALIRDGSPADGLAADDWCLGTPEEALPDAPAETDPAYELLYGHFICERAIPDPNAFALAVPEDAL